MTEAQFKNLKVGDIVVATSCGQKPYYKGKFKVIKFYSGRYDGHEIPESMRPEIKYSPLFGFVEFYGYPLCVPINGEKVHISNDMKRSIIPEERKGTAKLFYSCRSIKLEEQV